MLPAPGSRFDRYRIEALLGEGGMGRVYRAFDERLERRVALKILHLTGTPGSSDSRPGVDAAARLLREARAAAALDHPNAVSIFDVGEAQTSPDAPSLPFISMELIEGRSLRAFVGATEVHIEERTRWLTDVARAVAAAHARGLVHRDIKPENIMIRHDGVVKVLDFGIARRTAAGVVSPSAETQQAGARGTLTGEGIVIGTPLYMAPEQMRGEVIDGRADQFSWGVVAYELLSGTPPWDIAGDNLKIVSEVLSKQPTPLTTLNPETPALVGAVVARAMAKAPGDRFASMEELVASMQGRPTSNNATGPSTAVGSSFATAPTVQSTKTTLTAHSGVDTEKSVVAPSKRRGGRWLWTIAGALLLLGGAGLGVRRSAGPAKGTQAVTLDAAAPGATTVMDLPPPKTTPEALVAYTEGMRAMRAGDTGASLRSFRHAVELDPGLAAAQLRIAISLLQYDPAEVRVSFARAAENRRALGEHEQLLLDAFEPFVQRDPAQPEEARARFATLVARFPMDVEIAFYLARMDDILFSYDRAMAGYRRAIELDPEFVPPLLQEIELLALKKGDFDASIATSEQCERVNPGSTTCSLFRDEIDAQQGKCADLEASARRDIVRRPSSPIGYLNSAEALFVLGSPMASVREAMAQGRARMDAEHRAELDEDLVGFALEAADGRFTDAEKIVRQRAQEPASADSAALGKRSFFAWSEMQVAEEMGRPADAVAVAKDFRARSGAWTRATSEAASIREDHEISILFTLVHAGRLAQADLERARQAWLATWDMDMIAHAGAYLWVEAYARGATTPGEAEQALAALPRYQPFPTLWELPASYPIGRVYLLAGRVDEALPFLRNATMACNALEVPFDHLRAQLLLGQALESKNDVPGACAAYRVLLDRWGDAKPRSISAEAARVRVNALACAR